MRNDELSPASRVVRVGNVWKTQPMNNYGKTAIEAVKICGKSPEPDPVSAWAVAVREYCPTLEGQKKSCPRSTFLGLCEEGLVVGIPRGGYTRSRLNKSYAIRAVELINKDDSLAKDVRILWQRVMSGKNKQPNHQMDVVVALWQAEMLIGS